MSAKTVAPRLYKALDQVRRNQCDLTCVSFTSSGCAYPRLCFYCGREVLGGQNQSSWPVGPHGLGRSYAHAAVGNLFRTGGW